MENLKIKSVGKLVAQDYRTATVFKKFGINFCSKRATNPLTSHPTFAAHLLSPNHTHVYSSR